MPNLMLSFYHHDAINEINPSHPQSKGLALHPQHVIFSQTLPQLIEHGSVGGWLPGTTWLTRRLHSSGWMVTEWTPYS